jgi:PRC-barrel domain
MSAPVKDVSQLPGKTVLDQYDEPIGEISAVYSIGGEGHPTWVTVEFHTDDGDPRTVFIPLARLREEDGDLCVSYSTEQITSSPDVAAADELSEADERALRGYYSDVVDENELQKQRHRCRHGR